MIRDLTPPHWAYTAPDNTVLYAIGDLHGHLAAHNQLYTLLEIEAAKRPDKQHIIIYLGDYIDRGPQSAALLDKLIALKNSTQSQIEHIFLMGNHECGMIGFLDDPHGYAVWLDYGGLETLQSYGITTPKSSKILPSEGEILQESLHKAIPTGHIKFLQDLKKMSRHGDYAFVHAGIRPGVALHNQDVNDLLYMREPFLSHNERFEKCIIHGHTICKEPEIKLNRVNLDTGFYKNGILSCGVFEKNTLKILQININE